MRSRLLCEFNAAPNASRSNQQHRGKGVQVIFGTTMLGTTMLGTTMLTVRDSEQ